MLNRIRKNKEGFTIIEVLIVLAIAGLIMLIVFLAVPALQRNSRNTQRKADVSALLGAISEYSNNNGGKLPAAASDFTGNAKLSIYDSSDVTYDDDNNTAVGTARELDVVTIRGNAKCSSGGDDVGGSNANKRSIAVVYTVETGGSPQHICQES